MLAPVNLCVEYKKNPLGMDEKIPRFSYELNGDSFYQTAYNIQVFQHTLNGRELCWDSGMVNSQNTFQIEYCGKPLQRFTRYSWQVRVCDNNNEVSQWSSEEAFFETGFMDTAWQGKWLGCSWGSSYNPVSRLLRDFNVDKKIRKARLYATALGVYDLWINGQLVGGEDCLRPGWTDYFERVQYQAYDVTELICLGNNTLAATLGDGWYVCKGYGCKTMIK